MAIAEGTAVTDIEHFVGQDGRDEQVARVKELIALEKVEYVYYQFPSVTGRIMGKGVPANHWESMAEKGFQLVYGSPANLFVDRHGVTKPSCYHIDQFAELQPVIHKVVEYGQALGLDMIQGDHEDAPGQIELNFGFDRAEKTADNLSTFRQVCKQVGRELGLFPCFMPKPFMGVSGNGCHHNISLWKEGDNSFLPDSDDPQRPSQLGLWAIGGIIEHLRALTAITTSTVNSYRRLWDTGFWAPVFAAWGYQNRTTALRVSAPGRFEYRSADSAVKPYLSLPALIVAMKAGIDRKLDPGEPEERNIYEAMEAGKQVRKIPMTFGDALDALEADDVVRQALPGDMERVFMHYKRDEWERYCATVSDWDVEEYLDVLP